ncbi:lipase 3-like [Thrips palmi]|uniref:Lipase 3-like n=1 Tax=Thrips palmi TaxID=161013 RepID=A0A6P8ZM27_THRPL|nr:lipase 3-like [Thrips palmi]
MARWKGACYLLLLLLLLPATLDTVDALVHAERRPEFPRDARDLMVRLARAISGLAQGLALDNAYRPHRQSARGAPGKHFRGTRALVAASGYPLEAHEVRTPDGYFLSVFRIPRPRRPVVFLMHGLMLSSADYFTLGRGRALPLLLHDAGFDVWLGNGRGSMESRRHEDRHADDPGFWDFTWHEIGVLDLPSCIDHVLAATNQSALHYVGHSQGTTTFFVMGSERPEYMAKVKAFVGLAPVAFVRDIRSDLIRVTCDLGAPAFLRHRGFMELLPNPPFISALKQLLCSPGAATQPLCSAFLSLISGFYSKQVNVTMMPSLFTNFPGGSALKQLEHYCQQLALEELDFRQFDLKARGNLARYGQVRPPAYNLSRVTAPCYLIHADNDVLAVQSNVEALSQRLPNVPPDGVRLVRLAEFNHLDFIYGRDAKELVYDHVLAYIGRQERLPT